ncbi:tetratricopeptide repeat-containing sensor histidine kinase [Flavobacterium okayamense]|nr:sensor histidine kinase [Flavobacterium okayamense]
MKFRFLFLAIFSFVLSFSQQTKIDSLYQIINSTKNDSTKVAVYNQIVWKYLFSDKDKAKELLETSEKIALAANEKFGYNSVLGIKGIYYDINGNSDSARYFFNKSLDYSRKNKFLVHEEHTLNNLGMFHWNKGENEKALNYFFNSIKVHHRNEKATERGLASSYNNIGLIYQEMELFEKAIPYHLKALKIRIDNKDKQGQIASYNNLGVCYNNSNEHHEAKESFQNGFELAKEIDNKHEYYNAIKGLADTEFYLKNYTEALRLNLQTLNRPTEVPFNSKAKVHVYSSLAQIYVKLKNPKEAIKYGELGLQELQNDDSDSEYEVEIYKPLAEANYMIGNIEKGEFYNTKFYNSTIEKFKESSAKSLNELEVKYETEKKEKDLAKEKVKVAERELKIKNKNNLLLILGAFILSIVLVSLLIFNKQKFKNKQLQKEKELSEALLKIETNNRLQEQRLAISRDLHDNIGSQLTFIISSIDSLKMYMSNTEEKVEKKLTTISQFTRETIQELRDTIWAMNKEEISVEDLKSRISNFIEQAKASLQGIHFEFNCNVSKDFTFNSKDGINIYRIIQEAVNNAIKHASATSIIVNVNQTNQDFEISIKDNGKGFDVNSLSFNGNGLQTIQNRAKELNASIDFISDNNGTKVNLTFNK